MGQSEGREKGSRAKEAAKNECRRAGENCRSGQGAVGKVQGREQWKATKSLTGGEDLCMFNRNSFPAIADLAERFVAKDWTWSRPKPRPDLRFGLAPNWWIGTDNLNGKWVVKMTGSNCAYREHVFASLAQKLEIFCQSSVYLTIPRKAPPLLCGIKPEPHQLALWFFEEHQRPCQKENCPLELLRGELNTEADLENFLGCGISHTIDRINGEVLGYLCGQFEPPGWLFTVNHEFIQIDNELMFASGPVDLYDCVWLKWSVGRRCAADVCRRLSEMPDSELLEFAIVPQGYVVRRKNDIPRRLLAAKRAAMAYLKQINL
jgi:hypothetical protein